MNKDHPKQFGHWTVVTYNWPYSICRCSCGQLKRVKTCRLRSGESKSCGCRRAEYVADFQIRLWDTLKARSSLLTNERAA